MSLSTKGFRRPDSLETEFQQDGVAGLSASDPTHVLNLMPATLICVDYSHIKRLFTNLSHDGVQDLLGFITANPLGLAVLQAQLQIVTCNSRALALYEVADQATLQDLLPSLWRDDLARAHIASALALWHGETTVSRTATHYSLSGRRFRARVTVTVMPGYEHDWSQMLFVIEDITAEEDAKARLAESENYARALFQMAPVSLWVLDLSRVKTLLDRLRAEGVRDLCAYIAANPGFSTQYYRAMRVKEMNEQTLALFGVPDKATLLDVIATDFDRLFPGGAAYLMEEALHLWEGQLQFVLERKNRRLDGSRLDTVSQYGIPPDHEDDWSVMLVAEIDVTARKMAEERLAFLNGHDDLTGLGNRMAYMAERERLLGEQKFPIGIVIADLNGLKQVNDSYGHETGDMLLRRAGRVLGEAAAEAGMAARIGGDEFVILVPRADETLLATLMDEILLLTAQDNEGDELGTLSFALGSALCHSAEALDTAVQQADMRMYKAKRAHYA
jgi:diguanylate cyclase (GGDEF)-like protein